MKKFLIFLLILGLGSPIFALSNNAQFGLGFGTNISNFGTTPTGFLALSSKAFDIKLGFSAAAFNNAVLTDASTLSLLADLKNKISDDSYFTYGLSVALLSGRSLGTSISNGLMYGLFLGFQYQFNPNILLDLQFYPWSAQSYTTSGTNVYLNNWGSAVNISATYLF